MSKYEIGSLGWLVEQAKKDGFDNVRDWQNWKRDLKNKQMKQQKIDNIERRKQEIELCWYNNLVDKYGKEFAEWAKQNRGKTFDKYLIAGCKNAREYYDKCAKNAGFNNSTERTKKYKHNNGICWPMSDNPDCSSYFGNFIVENYIIQTFEDPIRMPYGNPGFDWLCKKGEKVDSKAACISQYNGGSRWEFPIRYNNIADWFILSAWDNRESLNPLHIWIFHKNDIVRGRKFWRRDSFSITNTPEKLKEFEKYEVTDRLDKLKELVNKLKEEET